MFSTPSDTFVASANNQVEKRKATSKIEYCPRRKLDFDYVEDDDIPCGQRYTPPPKAKTWEYDEHSPRNFIDLTTSPIYVKKTKPKPFISVPTIADKMEENVKFLLKSLEDDPEVQEVVQKKLPKAQQMLNDMLKYSVTCASDWPSAIMEKWIVLNNFDALVAKFYPFVSLKLNQTTFDQVYTLHIMNEHIEFSDAKDNITLLLELQGFSAGQIYLLANAIKFVFDRQARKRNTIWFKGVSNAGKTQLMSSLVDFLVGSNYGKPNNNPRSGFPFDGCINKRCILWEEPFINADNVEDVKRLLEGAAVRVDAKYKTAQDVPPSPCFLTSNTTLWNNVPREMAALKNRVHLFNFGTEIDDNCPLFPLSKFDWIQFFYKNLDKNPKLTYDDMWKKVKELK